MFDEKVSTSKSSSTSTSNHALLIITFIMNSRLFLFLSAALISTCMGQTSSQVFWYNSPIGFEYVCSRPDGTAVAQQVIGTDLMTRDLARCIGSGAGQETFVCQSTNVTYWSSFMRKRIKDCCSAPFQTFIGRRCVRKLEDPGPPETPVSGCKAKVRKTSLGIAVSCGCDSRKTVDVEFFVARNVDDCCLSKCVRRKSSEFCIPGISKKATRKRIVAEFSKCCGSSKCDQTGSVGTRTLNGGYTCGLDLKFGEPNPIIFDFPPLIADC